VLIPLFSFSQINQKDGNGKKHGQWQGQFPNTTATSYIGKFEHGKRVGLFKFYHQNGKLKAAMLFSKNGTFARAEMYYEDGTLIAKGNYVNEKKDSVWTYYGGSKNVRKTESWKMGKLHGETVVYFEPQVGMTSIPPFQTLMYKDSIPHGEVKEFYLNGKVKMKGRYLDGNLEGDVYYYYENGKRMLIERYKYAVRHEDGTLNRRRYFVRNKELKGKELEEKLAEIKNG
jgi:antitoxin component YwqK of YwqJK toxin-antitoxin module